jgi:hypothetical protein
VSEGVHACVGAWNMKHGTPTVWLAAVAGHRWIWGPVTFTGLGYQPLERAARCLCRGSTIIISTGRSPYNNITDVDLRGGGGSRAGTTLRPVISLHTRRGETNEGARMLLDHPWPGWGPRPAAPH